MTLSLPFATRAFRVIVRTCEQRSSGQQVDLLMTEDFGPCTELRKKLHNYLGRPTYVGLTYTESIAQNVKLWPKFEINRWPSYVAIPVYSIKGICRFRLSVTNCDVADLQGWPTSECNMKTGEYLCKVRYSPWSQKLVCIDSHRRQAVGIRLLFHALLPAVKWV